LSTSRTEKEKPALRLTLTQTIVYVHGPDPQSYYICRTQDKHKGDVAHLYYAIRLKPQPSLLYSWQWCSKWITRSQDLVSKQFKHRWRKEADSIQRHATTLGWILLINGCSSLSTSSGRNQGPPAEDIIDLLGRLEQDNPSVHS
jgi:hypothetical protein